MEKEVISNRDKKGLSEQGISYLEKKYNIKYVLNDSLLISYPKSGRTWLRMIMAKIITSKGMDNKQFEFMPATHYSVEEVEKYLNNNLKVVFLHRSIGDVLSSHHAELSTSSRGPISYTGTLSEFIRDPEFGAGIPIMYNKGWLAATERFKKIKIITYEDLKRNTFQVIKDIMNFLEFECSDDQVREAIEYSSFENMSKIEKGNGKNLLQHYKGNFGKGLGRVRRGKIGAYKEDFSAQDIDFLEDTKIMLKYDCQDKQKS